MTVLTIQDETATGKVLNETQITVASLQVTAEELITQRVQQEVRRYNAQQGALYYGLVQPEETERTLNNYQYKVKKVQPIDEEAQCYRALAAFKQNGFFILINNKQVEDLKELIVLTEQSKVSFIKLMALVGG